MLNGEARLTWLCWECREKLKSRAPVKSIYDRGAEERGRRGRDPKVISGTVPEAEWHSDDEQESRLQQED